MAVDFGTALEFESGAVKFLDCAEIDTDKFVVAYCDDDDTDAGKCRVATVSGGTISWGAILEFASDIGIGVTVGVCKLDTDKFVVVYADDAQGDDGYARVGSVSGNTITGYGAEKEFETTNVTYVSCCQLGTDKFAIIYDNATVGTACIGTVSGTTITTTAAPVAFEGNVAYTSCCKLDTDKFIAFYSDLGDSQYLKACAFTISGTTPTPGAISTLLAQVSRYTSCDQLDTDKCVVVWADVVTDTAGYIEIVTVSGTNITEGAQVDVNPTSDSIVHTGIAKVNATELAVIYEDSGNSEKGALRICTYTGDTVSLNGEEIFSDAQVGGIEAKMLAVCLISTNKLAIVYVDDADVSNHGEAIVGIIAVAAYWEGFIKEVKIYPAKAFSASEIAYNYNLTR